MKRTFILTLTSILFTLNSYAQVVALPSQNSPLADFTSDGCSSFPDGFGDSSWMNCCELHDIEYWAGIGGAEGKEEADHNLHLCLAQQDENFLSWLMPFGVRAGEVFNFTDFAKTSFRWGYGWKFILAKRVLPSSYYAFVHQKLHTIVPGLQKNRRQNGVPLLTQTELKKVNDKVQKLAKKLSSPAAQVFND